MFTRTFRLPSPRLSSTFRSIMTSATSPTSKRVPIPPNGVDYRNKVVLAPMVRSGELPCRLLALHYGADLVWGPETVDHAMLGTTRKINPRTGCIEFLKPVASRKLKAAVSTDPDTNLPEQLIYRLDPVREAGRHIFQIGTSDPERAAAVARLVAADVSGIDVNAGCPKPFSTSGGMGAALLRTPDKLCAILRSLVGVVVPEFGKGVSVKIRLLETPEKTESLVRKLCQTGITGLTIHCRTTDMRKTVPAIRDQLKMVGEICHEYGVACLMNGDVPCRDDALALARDYGVDGAMIATAAETNSSCFRPKEKGGMASWREAVEVYLGFAMDTENFFGNTKYTLNIMIPGKEQVHRKMHTSKSYVEVCELLGFEGLMETARAVDRLQGLDPETKRKAEEEKERQRKEKMEAARERERAELMAKKRKHSVSPDREEKISRRSASPVRRMDEQSGEKEAVASF